MRSFGAISAFLAILFSSADAVENIAVNWPENGTIKFSSPSAPPKVRLHVDKCFKLDVNFSNDQVTLRLPDADPVKLTGKDHLQKTGGELVVLFSKFGGQNHIIVNAESTTGGFETRMHSFPSPSCKVSKVRVSGLNDSSPPTNGHVFVSEEFVTAVKAAHSSGSVKAASQ